MEIYGGKGRSVLEGSGDDDSFALYAGKGTQRVDGGAGTDTVVLNGPPSAYWLERGASGVLLHIGEQTVQLLDIEQLRVGGETYSVRHALAPERGTAGDDRVGLFANQSRFDGGDGVDSVLLPTAYGAGVELRREGATWVVKTDGKALRLDNVEVLEFSNLKLDLRSQGELALQPMQHIQQGRDAKVIGNDLSLQLWGGEGNDELEGRGGDDSLYGGKGSDVAVFRGARSEYEVRLDTSTGRATVRDLVSGRDGSDELSSIEQLRFADGTVALDAVAERYASVTVLLPPIQIIIGSEDVTGVFEPVVILPTSSAPGMSRGEAVDGLETGLIPSVPATRADRVDAPSAAVELIGVPEPFAAGWGISLMQP